MYVTDGVVVHRRGTTGIRTGPTGAATAIGQTTIGEPAIGQRATLRECADHCHRQ
jgi:hypothetical protein